MKTTRILLALSLVACSADHQNREPGPRPSAAALPKAIATSQSPDSGVTEVYRTPPIPEVPLDSTLIQHGAMGMVRLCSPLADIDRLYPTARDSIVTGEDDQTTWPAKLVQLPDGHIFFEASWVDHAHVWRASTDSRTFHSVDGLRVGTTIDELRRRRDSLTIKLPEGVLVVGLPHLGMSFMLDSASAALLAASPDDPTTEQLPPTGTVALWFISTGCPQ